MNLFETNKISKKEFLKLNENDLMFITNPGRMGDEDGTTFIIKHGNEFNIYRIDGWMYPKEEKELIISLEDCLKQFPQWSKTWKHNNKKEHNDKYKYLYMGFGNGLSIDNSIYSEFEPYLNYLVQEKLKERNSKEQEPLKYATIFNTWEAAFINMANDKGYIIKKII